MSALTASMEPLKLSGNDFLFTIRIMLIGAQTFSVTGTKLKHCISTQRKAPRKDILSSR
jgi:hypothetical protein